MMIGPGLHVNLVVIVVIVVLGIWCAWITLVRVIVDTILRILLIVCLALHVHACVSTRQSEGRAVLLV